MNLENIDFYSPIEVEKNIYSMHNDYDNLLTDIKEEMSFTLDLEAKSTLLVSGFQKSLHELLKPKSLTIRNRIGCEGRKDNEFVKPHGFCLTNDGHVIVADTFNNKIKEFTHNGQHVRSFGVHGLIDGQLNLPRKVVHLPDTNEIVVCDRAEDRTRLQVFTRDGKYARTFHMPYVDIVACMLVDGNGHIAVVDTVSPTVYVFQSTGELYRFFSVCNVTEPSDMTLDVESNELYICDYKKHCVAVVNYQNGELLRKIGDDNKTTTFPNGIDLSADKTMLFVSDSHGQRLHVAIFNAINGKLIGEVECPQAKVSRCCGLKLTPDNGMVTIAKHDHFVLIMDYH